MTALAEFLFPAPARRSVGGIIGWWERRRLAYNVLVGGAGLASLGVVGLTELILSGPGGLHFVPWQPIVAFGVLANVCYCLGPAVEIALEKLWGRDLLPVGPALFRMGLTFSVGLALLPVLVSIIALLVNLFFALV